MAKHFVSITFLLTMLLFSSSTAYAQDLIVSTPKAIDNVVDVQNTSDYAIYEVSIYNYLNETIRFYFTDVAFWNFIYSEKSGIIPPYENKSIVIKMRPIAEINELPVVALKIYNNISRLYYLSFSPVVIWKKYNTPQETEKFDLQYVKIEPNTTETGKTIKILFNITSPSDRDVNIEISSDALPTDYKMKLHINKGSNIYSVEVPISQIIEPGVYNVTIKVGEFEKVIPINVKKSQIKIDITKSKNSITIKNLDTQNPVFYSYRMQVSIKDAIFKKFNPPPSYYITTNDGKTYAVWDVFLLPTESYTINIETNKTNIILLSTIIALLALLIIIRVFYPRIEVKKEIVKIDTKNKIIKILISVSNRGMIKIKDIKVEERILNLFKYKSSEFIKPVGVVDEKNYTKVSWYIDQLVPGEERVIVYTLTYDSEPVGDIRLDPTSITYKVFNRTFKVLSNTLLIRFAKTK